MTLRVDVYVIDEASGKRNFLESELGYDLAGVETTRHELWGADIMIELGLEILPSLRTGDIDVTSEGLDQLEQEVLTIRQNMALILSHVQYDEDTILQRTRNFLNAIQKAKGVNGGVVIW